MKKIDMETEIRMGKTTIEKFNDLDVYEEYTFDFGNLSDEFAINFALEIYDTFKLSKITFGALFAEKTFQQRLNQTLDGLEEVRIVDIDISDFIENDSLKSELLYKVIQTKLEENCLIRLDCKYKLNSFRQLSTYELNSKIVLINKEDSKYKTKDLDLESFCKLDKYPLYIDMALDMQRGLEGETGVLTFNKTQYDTHFSKGSQNYAKLVLAYVLLEGRLKITGTDSSDLNYMSKILCSFYYPSETEELSKFVVDTYEELNLVYDTLTEDIYRIDRIQTNNCILTELTFNKEEELIMGKSMTLTHENFKRFLPIEFCDYTGLEEVLTQAHLEFKIGGKVYPKDLSLMISNYRQDKENGLYE